jgi:hypothetical protein
MEGVLLALICRGSVDNKKAGGRRGRVSDSTIGIIFVSPLAASFFPKTGSLLLSHRPSLRPFPHLSVSL